MQLRPVAVAGRELFLFWAMEMSEHHTNVMNPISISMIHQNLGMAQNNSNTSVATSEILLIEQYLHSWSIHVHHQGEKGLCKLNERRIHDVWRPLLLTLAISPLGRGQIENVKWGNCVPEAKRGRKKGKENAGSGRAPCSNPEEHSAAWWAPSKQPACCYPNSSHQT